MRKILIMSIAFMALCFLAIACSSCSATDDDDDDQDDDIDDDDDETPDNEVLIPAGTFEMGCEEDDGQCDENELPRHSVYLDAYYIDVYEVTNQQYADYLNTQNPKNICDAEYGLLPCIVPVTSDEKKEFYGIYLDGDEWKVDEGYENRPVTNVSHYGATKYCETQGKRLPTEAEWERAAKVYQGETATYTYIYPWGDSWKENASNWYGSEDPYEDGASPSTTPVGYFDGELKDDDYQTADGWTRSGLADMAGNASEWVYDYYHPNYYEWTPEGGWINPQGPSYDEAWRSVGPPEGPFHVTRGGSYYNSGRGSLRTTVRVIGWGQSLSVGFRCVRAPL